MSKPRISVIIPVYNTQDYLEKCLESVINQTYSDIEIILINDGSTDNSPLICKSYAEKDTRIVFVDKENQGVSVARNIGINLAKGEWLFFLDSDDFLDLDSFDILLKTADASQSDLIYFGCRVCKLDKVVDRRRPPHYKEYQSLKLFLDENELRPASICLNFVKRENVIINNLSFNEKMKHNEDSLFVYSLYCHIKKFVVLDKLLYNIVLTPNSASRKPIEIKVLEDNLLFLSELCDYVRKYGLVEDYKKEINAMSKYIFVLALYFKDFDKYKANIQEKYRDLHAANKDIFYTSFLKIANLNVNIIIRLLEVKHFLKRTNYTP